MAKAPAYGDYMDKMATRLSSFPLGSRVVVRYRIETGFTDALGYLRSLDGTHCTVQTKRDLVTIDMARIVAAKQVPAPPERRTARTRPDADQPTGGSGSFG